MGLLRSFENGTQTDLASLKYGKDRPGGGSSNEPYLFNPLITENTFEELLCFEVEPNLGLERPTIINDYPASMAALSRKKVDNPKLAERFELYVDGIELANAYSELTDSSEQRKRFEECRDLRVAQNRATYDLDEKFLIALEKGMPEAGGIALGVDRLAMVMFGYKDISSVLAFGDE